LTSQRKCHKNVSKSALIDRFSSKTALLRDTTKKGSCKKTFIEKMKKALGYRVKGRKIISADDTFELREAITPFGNADKLDSGNTYLWNQPIDRLRIYRQPQPLISQFLHEN